MISLAKEGVNDNNAIEYSVELSWDKYKRGTDKLFVDVRKWLLSLLYLDRARRVVQRHSGRCGKSEGMVSHRKLEDRT